MCILPLFHNNGQITTLLSPLYSGGSTVIVRGKTSLFAFWFLVEKYEEFDEEIEEQYMEKTLWK